MLPFVSFSLYLNEVQGILALVGLFLYVACWFASLELHLVDSRPLVERQQRWVLLELSLDVRSLGEVVLYSPVELVPQVVALRVTEAVFVEACNKRLAHLQALIGDDSLSTLEILSHELVNNKFKRWFSHLRIF